LTNLIAKLDRLDKTIYENIFIYADPEWLRSICFFLVKSSHLAPVLILFFLYYTYKKPKASLFLLVSTLILLGFSEAAASFFKELFERHRPVYQLGIYISEGGYSFPSAHATNTMAFAVFWSSRFKSASPYLYVFSLIIGLARMFSNFHFPGDILGGWILGLIVGNLFIILIDLAEKKFKSHMSGISKKVE